MKKIGSFSLYFIFLALNFFSTQLYAETQVQATVDRAQMGIGDAFTLTVTVQSDEDFEAELPVLPKVQGLEEINSVIGARQSSSSMSIVNGKTQFKSQTSQDYQFLLSPQREGTFVIPPIDVRLNNQIYRTQPVKIEVGEEFRNAAPKNAPRGRPRFPPGFGQAEDEPSQNPFGSADPQDLFEQLLQQQQQLFGRGFGQGLPQFGRSDEVQSKNLDVNTKDVFFIYLDVDKTEVYEGEQVTANWYVYTRVNVESLDRVKFPDLKGFWKEIIEEVPALRFTEEIVNGVRYRKALLASHALFPIKPGTAAIDEFRIKAKVRALNQFGGAKPYDITKASKRTSIKVLPLPEEGKTLSFSGAVGQYRVTATTESNTYPANQPFSVRIRYDGIGNAKLIDLPQINWPEGLEVYDTKNDAKFFKEGNSYKEFEVLVIPRREGALKIPSLELTYFDPQLKKYITQATEEINLEITKGSPSAGSGTGVNVGTNPSDISAQKTRPQVILQWPEAGFQFSAFRIWFYVGFIVIGFLLIGFQLFKSIGPMQFQSEDVLRIQSKIKVVDQLARSENHRQLGAEAVNLIYLLVAHLAGQKKADQEIHILIREIPLNEQKKYLDKINILFDYFQLLGFSPDEMLKNVLKNNGPQDKVNDLKKLSQEIVDKIKKEDKTVS